MDRGWCLVITDEVVHIWSQILQQGGTEAAQSSVNSPAAVVSQPFECWEENNYTYLIQIDYIRKKNLSGIFFQACTLKGII